jgi:two-component system probable response regulator PhcQ
MPDRADPTPTPTDGPLAPLARVMVVDDEPLNVDLLRRTLNRHFEVVEADSAAEALRWLEAHGGDVALILCDQLMPGQNGTQLAAHVRRKWPTIRFVLVTGVDEHDDVVAAKKDGVVDEVVAKPWNARILRSRLRELAVRSGDEAVGSAGGLLSGR